MEDETPKKKKAKKTTTTTTTTKIKNEDSDDGDHQKPKSKRQSTDATDATDDTKGVPKKTYEERVRAVNIISQPLASKKSTKKIHKLVKKASTSKHIRRGVKELVKGIRKGDKGLAILAGDIYPLDVVSHLPVLLEESNIPYLFVPSKQDLGAAANTKRPTSCVLVKTPRPDFGETELYETLLSEAQGYDPTRR